MLKPLVIGSVLFLGLSVALSAQSNQRMDELLLQAPARLDAVAGLLLSAAGTIAEDADPGAAFDAAVAAGLVPHTQHPEDPVSVELLAFLVMKTQKMSGGIGWMLFPGPRTAYRELAFHELVNTSSGPGRFVAGDEVIRTLNAVVSFQGGRK